MSLDRHLEPGWVDPDFSDEEWEAARERLIEERVELGWDREDADAHIDDLMVREQIDADRADATHEQVDRLIKLRKEEGR